MRNILLTSVIVLLASAELCHADVVSDLSAYAKNPAKGIIDDAQKTAGNLISQAQGAGNGLVSHAGSELNTAAQSAILLLGNDINKKVEDLDAGEQNALVAILQLEQWANTQMGKAYDIKDTSVVDLTNWESHWLITKTPDFFVQSIRGTALLPEPGDYHITVTALGLGVSSESKASITASIDGRPIVLSDIDQTKQSGVAIIALPNASISPLFDQKVLVVKTLKLTVVLTRRHWYGSRTHSYDFPVYLTLYPKQVATVTVQVTTPTFGWVPAADVVSAPIVTQDKDGCKYCDSSCAANNALDVKVPGPASGPPVLNGERIVSANLECTTGSTCAFNGQQRVSIVSNGTEASATWVTCSHPTQWYLRAHAQVWEQTGSTSTNQTYDVLIDNPITVPIAANASLVTAGVKTFTGEAYSVILPGTDPHQVLSLNLTGQASSGQVLAISGIAPVSY